MNVIHLVFYVEKRIANGYETCAVCISNDDIFKRRLSYIEKLNKP
jgi:hypothetical protein